MKNLKIGAKLFVTFAVIILLLIATAGVAIYGLVQVGGSFTEFHDQPFQTTTEIVNAQRLIQRTAKDIGYGSVVSKLENINTYADNIEIDYQATKDSVQKVLDIVTDEEAEEALKETLTYFADIDDDIQQIADMVRETGIYCPEGSSPDDAKFDALNQDILNLYLGEERNMSAQSTGTIARFLKASDALDAAALLIEEDAEQAYDTAIATEEMSLGVLIAIAVVAVLVSLVFAIYITNGIKKPVSEIEGAMGKVLTGDFSARVNYQSKDELGSLATSINGVVSTTQKIIKDLDRAMNSVARGDFDVYPEVDYVGDFKSIEDALTTTLSQLSNTVIQISLAADQVATGSEQVSNGAQALSQGSTEQASSVEELAATISNINEQVTKSAEHSRDAAKIATTTGEIMQQSNHKMEEMISAMKEISHSSGEISKIIKTIEDIAFQTNILALNASVEAARAGAAGKGFAVVANEVGSLASKSAEASKSTAELIESSIRAVSNGTRIADDTAKSLFEAVKGAEDVLNRINEISEASDTQAESIGQITMGVEQISSVIQTNTATSEESAAASEQLSSQSQILSKLVSVFNPNKQLTQNSIYLEKKQATKQQKPVTPPRATRIDLGGGSDKY